MQAERQRLQPGSAAAVDLQPGHLHRQARVERRHPPERGRLAVRVALPEDHVVDGLAGQRGALQQPAQRYLAEFGGAERLQGAAVPADGSGPVRRSRPHA